MLRQLLLNRMDYWLNKRQESKNKLTKHSIDLVLEEILIFAKELYNSHLIVITTYLEIENRVRYKGNK